MSPEDWGRSPTDRLPRFRVQFTVSYPVAKEFVAQYAENLSRGGLFIAGAEQFVPGEELEIDLKLPGFGTERVVAKVVHVLDSEHAKKLNRKAGAGLEIIESSPDFQDDLISYLTRLGRRADCLVLVADEGTGLLLAAAGYQVKPLPAPGQLVAVVARSETTIAGIVLRTADLPAFEPSARAAGISDLIVCMDDFDQLDKVLTRLDQEL